jgi:hypothetical protein
MAAASPAGPTCCILKLFFVCVVETLICELHKGATFQTHMYYLSMAIIDLYNRPGFQRRRNTPRLDKADNSGWLPPYFVPLTHLSQF